MGIVRVRNLTAKSPVYTSNVYRISKGSGPVFLIDAGSDPAILSLLEEAEREDGMAPLSHVILTHNHYDHTQMLPQIRERYQIRSYAISPYAKGIDQILVSGDVLHIGGVSLEIIHIPGHTTDSLCVYLQEDGLLFSGDTPIPIWGTSSTFEPEFVTAFEEICTRDIRVIYPGHGAPYEEDCNRMMAESLRNLKKSRILF